MAEKERLEARKQRQDEKLAEINRKFGLYPLPRPSVGPRGRPRTPIRGESVGRLALSPVRQVNLFPGNQVQERGPNTIVNLEEIDEIEDDEGDEMDAVDYSQDVQSQNIPVPKVGHI